jgi:hypothetical protein
MKIMNEAAKSETSGNSTFLHTLVENIAEIFPESKDDLKIKAMIATEENLPEEREEARFVQIKNHTVYKQSNSSNVILYGVLACVALCFCSLSGFYVSKFMKKKRQELKRQPQPKITAKVVKITEFNEADISNFDVTIECVDEVSL